MADPRQTPRCRYSGTTEHPIYVDCVLPSSEPTGYPVIMIHGGGHTGSCYLATPDGRRGWADLFAEAGHPVYVPDWPGHGRSPFRPDFATLSGHDVTASIGRLLEEVGPAILLAHSAGAPVAWLLAEQAPALVRGIVGVAPGAPANILPVVPDDPVLVEALRFDEEAGCPVYSDPTSTIWLSEDFIAAYWANGRQFPSDALPNYRKTIVPESARIMNERFNIGGAGLAIKSPGVLHERPILVITGSMDLRHPRSVDGATARYLGADFVWLANLGIVGNGHMLMIEENSDEIGRIILDWVNARIPL